VKKTLLGLSLAVAALALLVPPAVAASSPQAAPTLSAADQAFLASLAAPGGAAVAPVPAAKRPLIGQKDLCVANCANGGTVSCSGTGTCTAVDGSCPGEPGHVTCNGVTTSCSACVLTCDDLLQECANNCSPCPIKTFQCSPYRCRCAFNTNCV
jgi:hypothetical protein